MTKEEAISKAADWWVEMVFSGVWDNGDAATEAAHARLRGAAHQPHPSEAPLLRKAFLELLSNTGYVYCDYGNSQIDTVFEKYGLSYSSSVHCPQKAGTDIRYIGNDNWRLQACKGYGKSWETLG